MLTVYTWVIRIDSIDVSLDYGCNNLLLSNDKKCYSLLKYKCIFCIAVDIHAI